MITVQPGYEAIALALLITDATPSDDRKASLATELSSDPAGRGYAGKTPAEILPLLCDAYSAPNPNESVPVPRLALSQNECRTLYARLSATLTAWQIAGQDVPTALERCIDKTLQAACDLPSLSLTDPATLGMLQYLVAAGALTQDEADAITTMPDPAYQATLYHPSRISVVWGDGLMPTLADIAEAI